MQSSRSFSSTILLFNPKGVRYRAALRPDLVVSTGDKIRAIVLYSLHFYQASAGYGDEAVSEAATSMALIIVAAESPGVGGRRAPTHKKSGEGHNRSHAVPRNRLGRGLIPPYL